VSGSGISWISLHLADNHASTPPLSFLQAGCPSCRPTNSVKELKAKALQAKPELEIWRRPATVTLKHPLLIGKATRSRFSQLRNYFRFCKSSSGLTTTTF